MRWKDWSGEKLRPRQVCVTVFGTAKLRYLRHVPCDRLTKRWIKGTPRTVTGRVVGLDMT